MRSWKYSVHPKKLEKEEKKNNRHVILWGNSKIVTIPVINYIIANDQITPIKNKTLSDQTGFKRKKKKKTELYPAYNKFWK